MHIKRGLPCPWQLWIQLATPLYWTKPPAAPHTFPATVALSSQPMVKYWGGEETVWQHITYSRGKRTAEMTERRWDKTYQQGKEIENIKRNVEQRWAHNITKNGDLGDINCLIYLSIYPWLQYTLPFKNFPWGSGHSRGGFSSLFIHSFATHIPASSSQS